MASCYPAITIEPSEHAERDSRRLYDFMVDDILATQHGTRFDIRPYSLEPTSSVPSPLSIDRPFCDALAGTVEHKVWLAKTVGALMMPDKDFGALVEKIGLTYQHPDVDTHLKAGGSLKWLDAHRTYAGQVATCAASWLALYEIGMTEPENRQITIASRVTSLFRHDLIRTLYELGNYAHHDGAITEDILLPLGGVLHTVPSTKITERLLETVSGGRAIRRHANEKTLSAYEQLLNRGGQIFFEAPSASEAVLREDGSAWVIKEVGNATIALTIDHNQVAGAGRIMVIPLFIESAPFTGDPKDPIRPHPTPFAILEPSIPTTARQFEDVMDALASAGTICKRSGQMPYVYERMRAPRFKKPAVLHSHSA